MRVNQEPTPNQVRVAKRRDGQGQESMYRCPAKGSLECSNLHGLEM